ncbi:MAG: hypothetical protein R2754_07615 [Microthrixaceae bacterium]
MDTQLSLLDLSEVPSGAQADAIGPAPTADEGARLAAARAILASATQAAAGRQATAQPWMSIRLDDATCELGRRRVAKARALVADARQRVEAEARAAQDARQRAALAGAISADLPPAAASDEPPPTRRPRRARPAA